MKRIILLWFGLIIFSRCSHSSDSPLDTKEITNASRRTQRVTFYNTQQQRITPDRFNQLLANGTYLSEERLTQDGTEEIYLIDLEQHRSELEGKAFPNFSITDLKGQEYTLEQIKGKVTIFSFWSTESQWCMGEIHRLNQLAQEYTQKHHIYWLAPSIESTLKVSHSLRGSSWAYSFVADQTLLARKVGILKLPTHLVVDQTGTIVKAIIRDSDSPNSLKEAIDQLL